MGEELGKTMAIPVMLEGEINQSTEDALKHEELKAQEEIEALRKSFEKGLITPYQMEKGIEEVEYQLRKLLIDSDILT